MKQLQGCGVLFIGAGVSLLMTQSVWAAATEVTEVRVNHTARGLSVVLSTSIDRAYVSVSGLHPQVVTGTWGNALIADIINIQLRLPQGHSFRQDNPAPGIASVVITQLEASSIRLVVTGTTSAPNGEIVFRDAKGITLSLRPASGTAALPPTTSSPISAPASTPAVQAPSTQQQIAQTPTTRTPNVLVPNPKITIDGKPASPMGTTEPESLAPPPLPHAVAPPVGDIAISNTDSSPATIDLGTNERVPRLVLRDAPVREVLALLARAAGLNLIFTGATAAPGALGTPSVPGQTQLGQPATAEGPTISLDIENESVQDVFNYVLRISSLQANRNGNSILVGATLSNEARNVIVRSYRLNQVTVGVALNYLVGFGAESAVSRERVITSVSAVPVGGSPTPATQTQTSTETRIETQRINFQDAVPLLRGLQAIGDERTNSIALIGSPKQVDIATTQLIQLDGRRRQVAVNVKIIDVNLLADQSVNTSFSFGIGKNYFQSVQGAATFNFGKVAGNFLDTGTAEPHSNRFLAVLQASITNQTAKILTDPTLIVQEGQQANVNLTQEVIGNISNQTTTSSGSALQTVTATKENVGLTVSIRIERIDDNGFIALSVAPVVRAPQSTVNLNLGSGNSQQITLVSERSLNSGLIRLRDSQTLILTGIIQDSDENTVKKVPILGDIPILGALFRSTGKNHQRQEVIVLLTPQIISDSQRSSFGYNYTPGLEVRQMLENRGLKVPKR